jgi:hypothetical protein
LNELLKIGRVKTKDKKGEIHPKEKRIKRKIERRLCE